MSSCLIDQPGTVKNFAISEILGVLILLALARFLAHLCVCAPVEHASMSALVLEEQQFFFSKLEKRVAASNSLLCIGLDPHESQLPAKSLSF